MTISPNKTIRAFIAVRPNDAAHAELVRVQRQLKKSLAGSNLRIKWTHPDTFHITLLFLGDIPAAETAPVFQALEKTATLTQAVGTSLDGAGLFRKSGALWVGIKSTPELVALQQQVAKSLEREPGRFHAHFTLGRIKTGRPGNDFLQALERADIEPVEFDIAAMELVQSELLPDGARHTVLAHVRLA